MIGGTVRPTPQQAAAICYRRDEAGVQFLLVRTLDDLWTFPKGNIEPGQSETDAAEMEAYEEAGVFGAIDSRRLTTYQYTKSPASEPRSIEIAVAAFLLQVQKSFPPQETWRKPKWFSLETAIVALSENRHARDAQELVRVARLAVERLANPCEP